MVRDLSPPTSPNSISVLIDIEGIDGAGKGTQARLLCERLQAAGVSHRLLSFPRYAETLFGQIAGEFLNGRFGNLDEVHPLLAALIFAGDRAESRDVLLGALDTNAVVVLDRYIPSNIAHQAAKRRGAERAELIERINRIEYEINRLPAPTLTVLLDLPAPVAQTLIASKAARNYTTQAADLQEADGEYLAEVREVYCELSKQANWQCIECVRQGAMRSMDEIASDVWSHVQPLLPVS